MSDGASTPAAPSSPDASVVLVHDDAHVRVLTMNRPAKKNAFDHTLYFGLAAALDAARDDDTVHVVVLTGAGGAFSSGQDLGEMAAIVAGTAPAGAETAFQTLLDAVGAFDKPLLAAVDGVAVGLGFTILAHCDLVYVSDRSRFRTPFTEMGVPSEAASSYLFAARMGRQHAARILLTSDWVTPDDVVAYGLAEAVCSPDVVVETTLALARTIASRVPESTRAITRLLRAGEADAVAASRRREEAAFAARIAELSAAAQPPA